MELTVKRVKLAELELLVAKVIQVTREQMVFLEKLVSLGCVVRTAVRVTQASLESQVLLALRVIQEQRVIKDIRVIQGHQEKRDLRGLLAHLDKKGKGEGEETLEQRENQVKSGQKERRENEGHLETEVGPGRMDSRVVREAQDYRDQGGSQEN